MTDQMLPSPYGEVPTFTLEPEGDAPCPGVVVLHDAGGMTGDLRNQARWLAQAGYLAAAPDLYKGGGQVRCMIKMMRDLLSGREDEPMASIEAARRWLVDHPRCTGKVGVIGFCMGGGLVMMLAPRGLYDAASANYGTAAADVEAKLAQSCPVVASYGARDRSLRGAAARLEELLTRHGVPHDVKEYPGVGHGFMNDHQKGELSWVFRLMGATVNTGYDAEATRDARRRILAFFGEHLSEPGR